MRKRYEALAPSGAYGPKTADTLVTMRFLFFLSIERKYHAPKDVAKTLSYHFGVYQ
jgi:hypothetical protein